MKILLAKEYSRASELVVKVIIQKISNGLVSNGIEIESFDFVGSKYQLDERLLQNAYDVLICEEQIKEDRISGGSIKAWREKYPDMRVILAVSAEKKGGDKLLKLLSNIPYYYDAVYMADLGKSGIVENIILHPRTREEAIAYYGLEERLKNRTEDAGSVTGVDGAVAVENSSPEGEGGAPAGENAESVVTGEPVIKKPLSEDDFLAFADSMADVDFSADGAVTEKVETEVVETVKENFDFSAFNTGDIFGAVSSGSPSGGTDTEEVIDLVGSAVSEKRYEDGTAEEDELIPDLKKMMDAVNSKIEKNESAKVKTETVAVPTETLNNPEDEYRVVSLGKKKPLLPEVGVVTRVIDVDTMLLSFEEELVLPEDKELTDYKIVFINKSAKGVFGADGKYRVGVKTFDGYPASLVAKNTVLVEIPNYNLEESDLEMRECKILFLVQ